MNLIIDRLDELNMFVYKNIWRVLHYVLICDSYNNKELCQTGAAHLSRIGFDMEHMTQIWLNVTQALE